jgi:hypothetical protein
MLFDDYPPTTLQRLDPRGCACTDCLIGYSRPISEATDAQLFDAARGLIDNASGQTLTIVSQVAVA